jgi:hypothetical protein
VSDLSLGVEIGNDMSNFIDYPSDEVQGQRMALGGSGHISQLHATHTTLHIIKKSSYP